MPAISDQLRLIILIITGISSSLFTVISIFVAPNIIYHLRTILPGEHRQGKIPTNRSWVTWIIFWISSVITIIGVSFASSAPTPRDIQNASKIMSGDYRVVVIPFSVGKKDLDVALGKEIANDLYEHLKRVLIDQHTDLVITLWGPENLDFGKGMNESDATKRTEHAVEIAERINADLVIYGMVGTQDKDLIIAPEYYVRSRNFYQAEEILGQYYLGAPVYMRSYTDVSDRVKFAEVMNDRTQVLSQIIIGLSYYSIQDYAQAQEEFYKAEETGNWQSVEGKEVLYLLLANAAVRQDNLESAENYYKKSLKIDNTYSRPLIGLGNIYYRLALLPIEKSGNPADLDTSLIHISREYLEKALVSENQPPLSDISVKVYFEFGEIYLMQKYGGYIDTFEPALSEFTKVIRAYGDGTNPRIKEWAAESHARIGLIYSLVGNIDGAIQEYKNAANLLEEYPERQKLF
jgi:tetratricopeptide (TPR) repeat protein